MPEPFFCEEDDAQPEEVADLENGPSYLDVPLTYEEVYGDDGKNVQCGP